MTRLSCTSIVKCEVHQDDFRSCAVYAVCNRTDVRGQELGHPVVERLLHRGRVWRGIPVGSRGRSGARRQGSGGCIVHGMYIPLE